ncbi:hypothetical protein ACHAXT_000484 [Thalassiosira profunda]
MELVDIGTALFSLVNKRRGRGSTSGITSKQARPPRRCGAAASTVAAPQDAKFAMVGSASAPAAAVAALALHLTLRASCCNAAAREASAAVEQGPVRTRRPHRQGGDERPERNRRRRQFVEAMEAAAADAEVSQPLEALQHNKGSRGGQKRQLQACKWYPDPRNQDGCTDDPELMLPQWRDNPLMAHDTADACCDLFYKGRECHRYPSGCDEGGGSGDDAGSGGGDAEEPSDCKWYPDPRNQDGCTDDPELMLPQWRDNPLMAHDTADACCDLFYKGRECNQYPSGCNGSGGDDAGGRDADAPTENCKWYPDPRTQDGCTDDPELILPEWRGNPLMLHDTSDSCCELFYSGRECNLYPSGCNKGGGDATGDADCEAEWHPDTETRMGCTNDGNVPAVWKEPEQRPVFFFATIEECCQKYHKGGRCAVRDACDGYVASEYRVTEKPTVSPTWGPNECRWHPVADGDASVCQFSDEYPFEWRTEPGRYLFDSHEQCCRGSYQVEDCGKVVICETEAPTARPTTPLPSQAPIIAPTASPMRVYYNVWNSHECVAESDYPRPHYVTDEMTFTDYEDCCHSQVLPVNRQNCLANAPTSLPIEAAATIYFVEHFGGMCLAVTNANPLPHYATGFNNYWECCASSHKKEECLAQGPTQKPTVQPTILASEVPSSEPSTSMQPSRKGPTTPPTTLYWGAYMAFSKPSQRPTKADCSDSLWHVASEADSFVCSNIDAELEAKDATMLFGSAEACCAHYFQGMECTLRDDCQLTDGVIPAERNWIAPEEECNDQWHPNIGPGPSGCSNSHDYPEIWETSKVTLFFDTVDECCEELSLSRGNHCAVYSNCATKSPTREPTPPPTTNKPTPRPLVSPETQQSIANDETNPCGGKSYRRCSRDRRCTYNRPHRVCELKQPDPRPPDHNLTPNNEPSTAATCNGKRTRKHCRRTPSCIWNDGLKHCTGPDNAPADAETTSCEGRKWHPTSVDDRTCSNSDRYPPLWDHPATGWLFDTYMQCCNAFYGGRCAKENVCEAETNG